MAQIATQSQQVVISVFSLGLYATLKFFYED